MDSKLHTSIEAILRELHDDLADPYRRTTAALRKVSRICWLTKDYRSLYWVEQELSLVGDRQMLKYLKALLVQAYGEEEAEKIQQGCASEWAYVHTGPSLVEKHGSGSDKPILLGAPIPQLEETYAVNSRELEQINSRLTEQDNLSWDARNRLAKRIIGLAENLADLRAVLTRVSQRIAIFAGKLEQQLELSTQAKHAFEYYEAKVAAKLNLIDAEAVRKLTAAVERMHAGDAESKAHALVSCRRVLHSFADAICPPVSGPIVCADGRERDLGPDKFKNRLVEYVARMARQGTTSELTQKLVQDTAVTFPHESYHFL